MVSGTIKKQSVNVEQGMRRCDWLVSDYCWPHTHSQPPEYCYFKNHAHLSYGLMVSQHTRLSQIFVRCILDIVIRKVDFACASRGVHTAHIYSKYKDNKSSQVCTKIEVITTHLVNFIFHIERIVYVNVFNQREEMDKDGKFFSNHFNKQFPAFKEKQRKL